MEISKTRLAIIRAVEAEMEHKGIDKVKVSHICNEVGISRTAFYGYFDDIYDVADWLWITLQQDALLSIGKTVNHYEGVLRNFQNLLEFRNFFRLAIQSNAYNGLTKYGYREAGNAIINKLEQRLERSLATEELLQFKVYNYGASRITQEWMLEGMPWSPDMMARVVDESLPIFFRDLLEPEK